MALPVEVTEFYTIMIGFWMLLPLMIRRLFLLTFCISAIFALLRIVRGSSDD